MRRILSHEFVTDDKIAMKKPLFTIVLLLGLLGCFDHNKDDKNDAAPDSGERASDDAGTDSVIGKRTSVTVGETGGKLELEEVNIQIPEGAVDEEVKIGIRIVEPQVPFPDKYVQVSDVYECIPHGYEFEEPIEIKISYREVPDRPYYLLRLDDNRDKSWEVVDSVRFRNGRAEFEVDHFSFFAVVYLDEAEWSVPDDGGGIGGSGGMAGSVIIGGIGGNPFIPKDAGIGVVDSGETCRGIKADPLPIEIEVPVEVPYEVTYPAPVAIYLMLDKSTSMNDSSGGETKWATAVGAINTFVNDPDSEFLDVGLQYFPLDTPSCDGSVYDTPAVPVAALPDNADDISSSLASAQLGAFTPIEPALRGMTSFCAQLQAENPDEQCVGVLISDGAPTQCALESNVLLSIAQNAYDNSDVRTFTVGMAGADFTLLNQIAMWGGTDCTPDNSSDGYACDVSSEMTLIQAFEAIRQAITTLVTRTEIRIEIELKIAECKWGIPDPPEGEVLDMDRVNVIFSEPGMPDVAIGRIPTGSSCETTNSTGWYYDDPASPTKIIACERTCDYIASVEEGSVALDFGCETIVLL